MVKALGGIYWVYRNFKGDYLIALDYIKRALEIDINQTDAAKGSDLHLLGETEFLIGSYREASKSFELASEVWAKIDDQKQNIWTQSWLALSELRLGNQEKARKRVKQIETVMKNIDPYPADIEIVNWNLSQVYDGFGLTEKSKESLKIAYNEVIKQANTFKNTSAREKFLANFRVNREVIAAWEKLN